MSRYIISSILFFLVIIFFSFVFFKYLSEENIKKINLTRANLGNDLNKNNTNLPLLKSDTDNVIEYNTDFSIKKDKPKRRFWKLMSNE